MDQQVQQFKVAVVAASWHADIVGQGVEGFLKGYESLGGSRERVDLLKVPGAFEIPLHAQRLAQSAHYDAIVAVGLIVDGGIYRHEFVNTAVIDGLMRVQLDTQVPVFSVVLTPHQFHEGETHQAFFFEHFLKKGQEAAQACVATVSSLRQLPTLARR